MSLRQLVVRYFRKRFTRKKIRAAVLGRLPNVTHVGARAVCEHVSIDAKPYIKKTFSSSAVGRACFERELAAQEIFEGRSWLAPVLKTGRNWLLVPRYPEDSRLDHVAPDLDEQQRLSIATQAVDILFDIFLQGYAHRDWHSRNLFLVDGQLLAIDFEVLGAHPAGSRPAFPLSYDLTGTGLDSPFETKQMCYVADDGEKSSLKHALGIPIDRVLEGMKNGMKEELKAASATFQTHARRHTCRAERIYGSFTLPHFTVSREEAQRHCARRLERFGAGSESLRDKTILDLGSNVGAMLFEAQNSNPGRCVGVEYDRDKVAIATKIAAYNGLNNVSFVHANIDKLKMDSLGDPFDVVFCLAIESHVKKPQRLYRLLAAATSGTLYFEGNATTDPAEVEARLRENGFAEVEYLGFSDDDCLADNNCRPLLVARK